jgi:hypothetical protein
MRRTCARPACGNPPVATLAYDYSGRIIWVDPLSDEPHPMTHDLCGRHADATTAPNGWDLVDRRVDARLVPFAVPRAS